MKNPNTSDEKKEEIRAKLKQLVRIPGLLHFMSLLINTLQGEPIVEADAADAAAANEES